MFRKSLLLATAAFIAASVSAASADEKGCCQKGTPGTCGAPVTVLGKKTCTLGWIKVTCSTKWNNCKNGWMLRGPALTAK